MERLGTEGETPVAPHEVRELLTRLNEESVEAPSPSEARTLGRLAVETGIPLDRLRQELDSVRGRRAPKSRSWLAPAALLAVTLGVGGWLWMAKSPKTIPVTLPASVVSEQGLVALDSVTYGLDVGQYKVEPTFRPTKAIKPGISISAEVGGVLWGVGDHRAQITRKPLTTKEEADLVRTVEELLQHVRNRAPKRGFRPAKPILGGNPEMVYEGVAYTATVTVQSYRVSGMAQVPIPPNGIDEEEFKRLSKAAAKRAVSMMQRDSEFLSQF